MGRYFALILFKLILLVNLSCQGSTNLGIEICECLKEISLNSDREVITNKYGKCIRPLFERFYQEQGMNKVLFEEKLGLFFDEMNNSCNQFSAVTEIWLSANMDVEKNKIPLDSIQLSSNDCDDIFLSKWIYKDGFEGKLIYSFEDEYLLVTNPSYMDTTKYLIENLAACVINLKPIYTNNPFDLIDSGEPKNMYFLSKMENTISAYFEVSNGIFDRIELIKTDANKR